MCLGIVSLPIVADSFDLCEMFFGNDLFPQMSDYSGERILRAKAMSFNKTQTKESPMEIDFSTQDYFGGLSKK
jgi:hypothetical protein